MLKEKLWGNDVSIATTLISDIDLRWLRSGIQDHHKNIYIYIFSIKKITNGTVSTVVTRKILQYWTVSDNFCRSDEQRKISVCTNYFL